MKLFTYWRSSASYRVRIALNLKRLPFESIPVNLKTGEQISEDKEGVLQGAQLPALQLSDGTTLYQSLAIIEYIDAVFPDPALLSENPVTRAHERAFAQTIAADTHPIQNLRVLKKLRTSFSAGDSQVSGWAKSWIERGFDVLEPIAAGRETTFAFGETPGLAECCLIPQIYNALRFGVDMDRYPSLQSIDRACALEKAFAEAAPENQLDAVA